MRKKNHKRFFLSGIFSTLPLPPLYRALISDQRERKKEEKSILMLEKSPGNKRRRDDGRAKFRYDRILKFSFFLFLKWQHSPLARSYVFLLLTRNQSHKNGKWIFFATSNKTRDRSRRNFLLLRIILPA